MWSGVASILDVAALATPDGIRSIGGPAWIKQADSAHHLTQKFNCVLTVRPHCLSKESRNTSDITTPTLPCVNQEQAYGV